MKRISIICLFLLFAILLHGQITNIDIISSKTYENQKTTCYFKITGFIPIYLIEDLTIHIESHPDVEKFSFYNKSDSRKCMCTFNSTFNEEFLIETINDFLIQFEEFNINDDFLNTIYFEDNKSVKFIVQGINNQQHKNSLQEQISTHDGIISIEINPDNICKLTMTKNISKQYITSIFESYSLSILEIYHD